MTYDLRLTTTVIESTYPITFRASDAQTLGTHLKHGHSVTLIGMKRVGISNFLRFFLYHPQVPDTYLGGNHRLFIPVDLNDLIEVDLYAFWKLTLKRLTDTIEARDLPESLKKYSRRAFLEALQLKDLMVTIDNLKKILLATQEQGYSPTLFLIRFDRLKSVFTETLFGNLQSLIDATNQNTTIVFTSYRPLHQLSEKIFPKSALSVFTQNVYLQPANPVDSQIVLDTFANRYELQLPQKLKHQLIALSSGHVQYLQLALIHLKKHSPKISNLKSVLVNDEEINLQSEELVASLTKDEQQTLVATTTKKIKPTTHTHYLWDTGLINTQNQIFSPLLESFITKHDPHSPKLPEFTKKELLLFTILKEHQDEVVERDQITQAVWPDQVELGVSDWAIDRLVGRVRTKLRTQHSPYKIQTVITRGYKLIET